MEKEVGPMRHPGWKEDVPETMHSSRLDQPVEGTQARQEVEDHHSEVEEEQEEELLQGHPPRPREEEGCQIPPEEIGTGGRAPGRGTPGGIGEERPTFTDGIDAGSFSRVSDIEPWMNIEERQAYQAWISERLKAGHIEVCSKEDISFTSNPRFVLKSTTGPKEFRVTHDFTLVNSLATKDAAFVREALPDNIQTWASSLRMAAKWDCTKAFHEMPMEEAQRRYYGFYFDGQYYRYLRLPMGVRGGPKSFHLFMDWVLNQLSTADREYVRHYQDDVIIGADSEKELQDRANRVRKCMERYLRINEKKSAKGPVLQILGLEFDYTNRIIRPPQQKIEDISRLWERIQQRLKPQGTTTFIGKYGQVTLRMIQRLLGKLQFLVKIASVFAVSGLKTVQRAMHFNQLSPERRTILDALVQTMPGWKTPMMDPEGENEPQLQMDASPSTAAGLLKFGPLQTLHTVHQMPIRFSSSAEMEAGGAWTVVKTIFTRILTALRILKYDFCHIATDNMAFYSALTKMRQGKAATTDIEVYARKIILLFQANNIDPRPKWLPTGAMEVDALTRDPHHTDMRSHRLQAARTEERRHQLSDFLGILADAYSKGRHGTDPETPETPSPPP